MIDKLKRNWNKTPMIPHKAIINAMFLAWGFMAVMLLVIGVSALTAIAAPAGITLGCYLLARLMP